MPSQASTCVRCGATFHAKPSKQRQFCTFACYQVHRAEQRPTAVCQECGETFTPQSPSVVRAGHGKFCSESCQYEYNRQRTTREFWKRAPASSDPAACQEWTGTRDERGYGRVKANGRMMYAHRLAWELAHGPIPDGMSVLHICDNPPCCHPMHLFLGTYQDNSDDKYHKGRERIVRGVEHPRAKITEDDVRAIRRACAAGVSHAAVAHAYHMGETTITHIVRRESWKHVE